MKLKKQKFYPIDGLICTEKTRIDYAWHDLGNEMLYTGSVRDHPGLENYSKEKVYNAIRILFGDDVIITETTSTTVENV